MCHLSGLSVIDLGPSNKCFPNLVVVADDSRQLGVVFLAYSCDFLAEPFKVIKNKCLLTVIFKH